MLRDKPLSHERGVDVKGQAVVIGRVGDQALYQERDRGRVIGRKESKGKKKRREVKWR